MVVSSMSRLRAGSAARVKAVRNIERASQGGRRRALGWIIGGGVVEFGGFRGVGGGGAIAKASKENNPLRTRLLEAIDENKGIESAIENLVTLQGNPLTDAGSSELLKGRWRLLWSSSGAEVARFTKYFPLPFQSFQLIGEKGGLVEGRAGNIISTFGGTVVLKLTSSALPSASSSDAVEIGPPFRLELVVAGKSIPLGAEETVGSDESALLGSQKNQFTQLYVETSGFPGDIRVSRVTNGDPVVVGSTFVHVRV